MATTDERRLFQPLSIKSLLLKNRICIPALVTFYWSDASGKANERHTEHYRSLAEGGAGLVTLEATSISRKGRLFNEQLGLWDDAQIPALKKIVDAVHSFDCPIIIQLNHAGAMGASKHSLAPSEFHTQQKNRVIHAKEISVPEILDIEESFAAAAVRAQKAGFDGIELHAAHGYLFSQFLNTRINKRTDKYGEQPSLFLLETFSRIKDVVSDNMVIGIRMSAFEPTIDEGIANAEEFDNAGFDFLNVSRGLRSEIHEEAPFEWCYSPLVYGAMRIRESLAESKVKIFAVEQITSPAIAEAILTETNVDIVNIGRGSLVNPHWAKDAKAGRPVGTCLDCSPCRWGSIFKSVDKDCPGRALFNK